MLIFRCVLAALNKLLAVLDNTLESDCFVIKLMTVKTFFSFCNIVKYVFKPVRCDGIKALQCHYLAVFNVNKYVFRLQFSSSPLHIRKLSGRFCTSSNNHFSCCRKSSSFRLCNTVLHLANCI